MAPVWSSQPLKAIYTIFFLLKTPPYAAALFLYYLAKPAYPECKQSIFGGGGYLHQVAPPNSPQGTQR